MKSSTGCLIGSTIGRAGRRVDDGTVGRRGLLGSKGAVVGHDGFIAVYPPFGRGVRYCVQVGGGPPVLVV